MTDYNHPRLPGFPLLPTTVVGSYPISPGKEELLRSYYDKKDPYLRTIEACVREQARAGVQIVSDGQTRASMVNIFSSKLAGIRMKGKPVVFSELRFTGPITLTDQKYALNIIKSMDAGGGGVGGGLEIGKKENANRNECTAVEEIFLKGIITGPHTMSLSVNDTFYKDEKELALAFASALNQEARALQEVVPIIQFDEPFFSVQLPDYATELISELVEGIDVPVALHACGDVSAIFAELVELPVTILDHEFTANPGLLNVIREYDFSQMLGLGVVRSDKMEVERVEGITERIRRAVEYFGAERLMVDPDCGMRHLTPEVAFQKLRNIRMARDEVVGDV
ncbi:MAG: methionine synthase [Thermoplasmata archaeon]|nr:methionine synthase [Thermoplasmata archaeon]